MEAVKCDTVTPGLVTGEAITSSRSEGAKSKEVPTEAGLVDSSTSKQEGVGEKQNSLSHSKLSVLLQAYLQLAKPRQNQRAK